MARPRRLTLLIAVAIAVVAAGAALALVPQGPPPELFVDPQTAAAAQVRQWEAEGRAVDAADLREIAERPLPLWASGDRAVVEDQVRSYTGRATAAGARPLLVAYNIPHRDCGSFSGGGAPDAGYYRDWIGALAAGIDGSGALVVLEPDAVPHELSGCVDGPLREERYVLLADAVRTLKDAGAGVYLDAGNPGFITDPAALAGALRRSGIDDADGFSLNVANFYPTPEVVAFGRAVSEHLGGVRFVIDTSRNGQGRPAGPTVDGAPSFCNPPGRGLGTPPTTRTGDPLVDALLWIKRPGESDGACRPGEPPAGQWWAEYALGLARRSAG